jgi:hypothetical protein
MSQLQTIAVALNKRSAPDVALNQSFGFEFGVGIGNRSSMNAQHCGKFAAGRNAVTGTKVPGMD